MIENRVFLHRKPVVRESLAVRQTFWGPGAAIVVAYFREYYIHTSCAQPFRVSKNSVCARITVRQPEEPDIQELRAPGPCHGVAGPLTPYGRMPAHWW